MKRIEWIIRRGIGSSMNWRPALQAGALNLRRGMLARADNEEPHFLPACVRHLRLRALAPICAGRERFRPYDSISSGFAAATFFALGLGKGAILGAAPLRAALQTWFLGSAAAILAYGVGLGLGTLFGVD